MGCPVYAATLRSFRATTTAPTSGQQPEDPTNIDHATKLSVVRGANHQSLEAAPFGAPGALADASFIDATFQPSDVGHLEVVTRAGVPDVDQMRAAGWAEGYLTAARIHQHYTNMWAFMNLTAQHMGWLEEQHTWLRAQLEHPEPQQNATFWDAVRLLIAQFDGLVELYFLSSMADMQDVQAAMALQAGHSTTPRRLTRGGADVPTRPDDPDWDSLSAHDVAVELNTGGRCTAFVKVAPDYSDIWVGQAAWYTYAAMLRVFKHFTFHTAHPGIVGSSLAFSSYPGQMASDDDFYLMAPNHLAVLQTTNRIWDASLLQRIENHALLSWQRVRTANAMAVTGDDWGRIVATHNSGTYTNSWLVVALGAFNPGHALPAGLLTVVEQIPGAVFWADKTEVLASGFFALYNVPVLPEVYTALGYPQFLAHMAAKGPQYLAAASGASYQLAPRAKIFRRDQHQVVDMLTMRDIMRQNNWREDPFSMNVSTNAICGRGDVDPKSPRAAGCYDAKATNLAMGLALVADMVNGPPHHKVSTDNSLPPFAWAEPWSSLVPHMGQPKRFAFEWQRMARTHGVEASAAAAAA